MSQTTAAGYRRQPLPLNRVRIDDPFWSPRQELIRTQTLPQQQQLLRRTGHYLQWRNRGLSDMTVWIREAVTPTEGRHST